MRPLQGIPRRCQIATSEFDGNHVGQNPGFVRLRANGCGLIQRRPIELDRTSELQARQSESRAEVLLAQSLPGLRDWGGALDGGEEIFRFTQPSQVQQAVGQDDQQGDLPAWFDISGQRGQGLLACACRFFKPVHVQQHDGDPVHGKRPQVGITSSRCRSGTLREGKASRVVADVPARAGPTARHPRVLLNVLRQPQHQVAKRIGQTGGEPVAMQRLHHALGLSQRSRRKVVTNGEVGDAFCFKPLRRCIVQCRDRLRSLFVAQTLPEELSKQLVEAVPWTRVVEPVEEEVAAFHFRQHRPRLDLRHQRLAYGRPELGEDRRAQDEASGHRVERVQ
ncbi:MAG: hypothetical protein RB148_00935, partial [Armatimonadota bacterium]|nr:hypothetical protein [Armatimonadota bacterium]